MHARKLAGPLLVIALLAVPALALQDSQESSAAKANKLFAAGQWAEAATAYEAVVKENPDDGQAWFRLGYALHASGQIDKAIEAHRKAAEFPQGRPVALYNLGCAYSLKGRKDEAFDALTKAVAAGFNQAGQFASDPDLAALRDDPRFAKLVASIPSNAAGAVYRQFDFWVGQWDVFDPQGQKIGTSTISKREKGFVIFEEWTSARGNTGISMNYYDPEDHKWKQLWVSAIGGVVRYEGQLVDGAMKFEGTTTKPDGTKDQARCTFTPLPGGKVRQFIQQSTDGGKTWTTYFDGTYVPRSEDS